MPNYIYRLVLTVIMKLNIHLYYMNYSNTFSILSQILLYLFNTYYYDLI